VSVKRSVTVLLLLALLLVAGGYGLFAYLVPSVTLRYRLTLEADVAGHHAVGSGVIEVTREDNRRLFGSLGGFGAEVRGQAVILDLDDRGLLFALLRGSRELPENKNHPMNVLFYAFPTLIKPQDYLAALRELKALHPTADLPFDLLPMLVRFRDLSDPASVEQVQPNDLAAAFGPGVELKKATIAITDDPVTTGIEHKLPWLAGLQTVLAGKTLRPGPSVATVLSSRDFERGF
jgi:hypothetical protein